MGSIQLDAFVESGGLRVQAYHRDGRSIELSSARGVATVKVEGNPKRYRYDLFPVVTKRKRARSLAAAVDLSEIAGRNVEVTYQLAGIPGSERRPLQFTDSVAVPDTAAQQVAADIAAQKLCPVSGQPLGSMGEPVAVKVGDQTVYVCCAGCVNAVKANPQKFLPAKPTLTAAPATSADSQAIALQKVCPVMNIPLGDMGTPVKVTGLKRDVYLCCKGCLKKLEQTPEKYLAKLPRSNRK